MALEIDGGYSAVIYMDSSTTFGPVRRLSSQVEKNGFPWLTKIDVNRVAMARYRLILSQDIASTNLDKKECLGAISI